MIVCPLVFLAGFVDAIAGGGGLISLPAYMFAGVPVHNAIATNKLSSCTGTVVSTWRLIKNKRVDWYFVPGTVVCALAGSVIGANLALIISDEILKTVLVVLLPIVAFCVLRDKNLEVIVPEGMTRRKQYIIAVACSLGIGIYDGFYGPGTGTFLLLAFTKLAKMDLEKSTGNVKAVNLASNISALITFILAGKILWTLGLAASCFSIAGHYTGAGMVMQAEPIYRCYEALQQKMKPEPKKKRVIYVTPQGHVFDQKMAEDFAKEEELVFLCGHYEGVDERVLEEIVTDYVSIGDYVLTGGELPAMVMMDTISRLVPGVLHNKDSAETESFADGLLEYPQYTRPEEYHGKKVPEVLLSGHHKNIEAWRLERSLERTKKYRPDLYEEYLQR